MHQLVKQVLVVIVWLLYLVSEEHYHTFKDFQQTTNGLFAQPLADLSNMTFGKSLGSIDSNSIRDKFLFGKDNRFPVDVKSVEESLVLYINKKYIIPFVFYIK